MCLHLVVMDRVDQPMSAADRVDQPMSAADRVDQPMSAALGCCTKINWLEATISVCVAYVVGFSMSWRWCSKLWYCCVREEPNP